MIGRHSPLRRSLCSRIAPAKPGFVLQQAGVVNSNLWSPAPSGAQNPVVLPAGERARFFRLVKP